MRNTTTGWGGTAKRFTSLSVLGAVESDMRIAAIQCLTVPDNLDYACDVLASRLEWADQEAIDLVLFPEAFILGHSYEPDTIERRAERISSGALTIVCTRPPRLPVNAGGRSL